MHNDYLFIFFSAVSGTGLALITYHYLFSIRYLNYLKKLSTKKMDNRIKSIENNILNMKQQIKIIQNDYYDLNTDLMMEFGLRTKYFKKNKKTVL